MIVYALFFILAVESWAQDFDVASDASAIGNTTTSPVDPIEQLRQIVEEHTEAIASLRQEMNETVKGLTECALGSKFYYTHSSGRKGFYLKTTISFGQNFKWTPNVIASLNGFNTLDEDASTSTDLQVNVEPSTITPTQFVLTIEGKFVSFFRVDITWVACA